MFEPIIQAIRDERKERQISTRAMAIDLVVRQQTLDRILKRERRMGRDVAEQVLMARPEWWSLLQGGEELC